MLNGNVKYSLCKNRDISTNCWLAVIGGGSIGKCGRLSQPSWILAHTII